MAFILLKKFLSKLHLKLIGLIGPRAVSERVKLVQLDLLPPTLPTDSQMECLDGGWGT
jgi:hypothetical protein